MRLGIFGGSFNPVHNGHLALAKAAMSELNLDRIYFVPCGQPVFKSASTFLPASLRLECLRQALKNINNFQVSDYEVKRPGVSYTVHTLEHFKKKYGAGTRLFFLAGADTLASLEKWKNIKRVRQLCRFVILTRPGYNIGGCLPEQTIIIPFNAVDVSASTIRARWREGQSLRGMVPSAVERLLNKQRSGLSIPKKK